MSERTTPREDIGYLIGIYRQRAARVEKAVEMMLRASECLKLAGDDAEAFKTARDIEEFAKAMVERYYYDEIERRVAFYDGHPDECPVCRSKTHGLARPRA